MGTLQGRQGVLAYASLHTEVAECSLEMVAVVTSAEAVREMGHRPRGGGRTGGNSVMC